MYRTVLLLISAIIAIGASAQPLQTTLMCSSTAKQELHMSVWQMTAGGAIVRLQNAPDASGNMDVIILDSPDFALAPGTCVGKLKRTVQPNVYDLALADRVHKGKKGAAGTMRSTFTAEFTPEGRMLLKPYKKSWSVNVFRLLPYLFRVSVHRTDTRPDNLDGAVRLSPSPYYPVTAL